MEFSTNFYGVLVWYLPKFWAKTRIRRTINNRVKKHVEGYLDYFEYNLNTANPSVMGGLKDKE